MSSPIEHYRKEARRMILGPLRYRAQEEIVPSTPLAPYLGSFLDADWLNMHVDGPWFESDTELAELKTAHDLVEYVAGILMLFDLDYGIGPISESPIDTDCQAALLANPCRRIRLEALTLIGGTKEEPEVIKYEDDPELDEFSLLISKKAPEVFDPYDRILIWHELRSESEEDGDRAWAGIMPGDLETVEAFMESVSGNERFPRMAAILKSVQQEEKARVRGKPQVSQATT